MIIWNSDGSQTENSGNGIRIFAKYLKDADYVQKKDITIYTDEKEIEIHYLNEEGTRLKASMGKASFWSDEVPVEGPRREIINETMVFGHIPYPVTCISVGNPHLVILMDEISKDLVCRIGKYSETAKQFPEKINTQIIKVLDRTHLQTEVYERGAGYTLASGSGCCAAAAASLQTGTYRSENDRADAGRYHGSRDPGRRGDLSYRRCRLCGKHQPGKLFYRTVEAGIG